MSKFALARLKLKLADILLTQEQFNRALVFYTQVHSQIKNSTLAQEARFKAAKTSFYKGDFDWAESQLKVLKSSTSQLIANDALDLQLLITDHKFGDSLQTPLKLYAKADFLNFQNKPKESFKVLDTLITVHSTHPIVDQALMLQAQILESEEDHKAAAAKYHIVIQDFSQEILADDAYFALAELYRTVLNDSPKAQQWPNKSPTMTKQWLNNGPTTAQPWPNHGPTKAAQQWPDNSPTTAHQRPHNGLTMPRQL